VFVCRLMEDSGCKRFPGSFTMTLQNSLQLRLLALASIALHNISLSHPELSLILQDLQCLPQDNVVHGLHTHLLDLASNQEVSAPSCGCV
jgi:hypothetical protein